MKSTLMMLALLFSCFVSSATARADGFRSYISPSGSDNRQCTRSQPCRTFDGAMAKTDEGGEIIALETSTYDPVTITKSVTLTAAPTADVVIKGENGNAVTVNGATKIVVLRGLKIAGPGRDAGTFGLFVDPQSILSLSVENCVISGFDTGIRAVGVNSLKLIVTDSVIRTNEVGMMLQVNGTETNGAAISRTRFEHNLTGLVTTGTQVVAVNDSVVVANTTGFLVHGRMGIFNSMVSRNLVGVETQGNGVATIGSSTIMGNERGWMAGGPIRSMGNNMFAGNHFDIDNVPNVTIIAGK